MVEIKTKEDLYQLLKSNIDFLGDFDINDITVRHYARDPRIGWNTHIVKIKDIPVGFSDALIK